MWAFVQRHWETALHVMIGAALLVALIAGWHGRLWSVCAVVIMVAVIWALLSHQSLGDLYEKARELFLECRASLIAKFDHAPDYWPTPSKNEEHARYRSEYERLVKLPSRSRGDLALLAEMLAGLEEYGDDPLARPPKLHRQAFAQFSAAGDVMGVALSRWTWIIGALGLATIIALFGWVKLEQAAARVSCSASELRGHTERQPCLDLASAQTSVGRLQESLENFQEAHAADVGAAAVQAAATRTLNQRTAARNAARAERQRRAHDDDVEALRGNRAPDWDGRLRDLTAPAASDGNPDPGAGAGVDPTGGVSGERADASGVRRPDAAAAHN